MTVERAIGRLLAALAAALAVPAWIPAALPDAQEAAASAAGRTRRFAPAGEARESPIVATAMVARGPHRS